MAETVTFVASVAVEELPVSAPINVVAVTFLKLLMSLLLSTTTALLAATVPAETSANLLISPASAVTPSKILSSAVVAVTPSIILSSAVVAVTPSIILSSAAVAVIELPAIWRVVAFTWPAEPYTTALLFTTDPADEPSIKFNSAVVDVTPSNLFISPVVAVTPSIILSSAAVAVIELPAIWSVVAFTWPAEPYITALLFTTDPADEPSTKFNSAVVAVTPSIILSSAVVAVTPSIILSSAAVAVIELPAIWRVVILTSPESPYITALPFTTAPAVEPSTKFNSVVVDVTPSIILSSAVVAVTPSIILSSAAVADIDVPAICSVVAFTCPAEP